MNLAAKSTNMNSNRKQSRWRRSFAVLFAVLLAGASAAAGPLKPGDPAPAFKLPASDGKVVSLDDFKGKVVLVDFWASWCGPCRQAFPALNDLYGQLKARGFEVIAVNLDEQRKDADEFLSTRPHELTVVFDPKGTSAASFRLGGMPSSFVIDRDGRVQFTHTGYTAATLAEYRREVLSLLRDGSPAGRYQEGVLAR